MNAVWLGSYLLMWALLLVIAVVLLSVMRKMGRLYHMLEQAQPAAVAPSLPLNEPLPAATLRTLAGETVATPTLGGTATLFVVVSPHCGPCHDVLDHLAATATTHDPFDARVDHTILISVDERAETDAVVREHGVSPTAFPIFFDNNGVLAAAWHVHATPTFISVDAHNRIVGVRDQGSGIRSRCTTNR